MTLTLNESRVRLHVSLDAAMRMVDVCEQFATQDNFTYTARFRSPHDSERAIGISNIPSVDAHHTIGMRNSAS